MKFILFLTLVALPSLAFGQQAGTISGTVVDSSGATVAHAQIKLALDGRQPDQETQSSDSGQFSFPSVTPGPYQLIFIAKGLANKSLGGELRPGETLELPPTTLAIATLTTDVNVTQTQSEIAEAEIKLQEKQRIAGLIPNYFVNYNPDAAPLNAKQKFELSWKTLLDPSSFIITGIISGVQQAQNTYKSFGQGAQGYGERYAVSYGSFVTGVLIGGTIMPAIFKQDPRYFVKGTGSVRSRAWYAINRSVICQGDNKKPQFCYSSLAGELVAGGISRYYVPAEDRNSAAVTFENFAIGVGGDALGNLIQEFILRKITTRKH